MTLGTAPGDPLSRTLEEAPPVFDEARRTEQPSTAKSGVRHWPSVRSALGVEPADNEIVAPLPGETSVVAFVDPPSPWSETHVTTAEPAALLSPPDIDIPVAVGSDDALVADRAKESVPEPDASAPVVDSGDVALVEESAPLLADSGDVALADESSPSAEDRHLAETRSTPSIDRHLAETRSTPTLEEEGKASAPALPKAADVTERAGSAEGTRPKLATLTEFPPPPSGPLPPASSPLPSLAADTAPYDALPTDAAAETVRVLDPSTDDAARTDVHAAVAASEAFTPESLVPEGLALEQVDEDVFSPPKRGWLAWLLVAAVVSLAGGAATLAATSVHAAPPPSKLADFHAPKRTFPVEAPETRTELTPAVTPSDVADAKTKKGATTAPRPRAEPAPARSAAPKPKPAPLPKRPAPANGLYSKD